jgi:signal transduction histidine kinase
VSHELRTPLTSIVGFATMLDESFDEMPQEKRDQALHLIRKGARRLERMILNLLEVSRIERRRVAELVPVDIDLACATAVTELQELYPHREIRFTRGSGTVQAVGNQLSVEQILSNLVGNALKYSIHGPVGIRVEEAPGQLTVTVSDSGPGIPAVEQERIFERFHRVDQEHVQAGTGLGLYISRQLATSMNGTLSVSSVQGEGSSFTLTLPAELRLSAVS